MLTSERGVAWDREMANENDGKARNLNLEEKYRNYQDRKGTKMHKLMQHALEIDTLCSESLFLTEKALFFK